MCGLDGRPLSGTGKFEALGFDGNTNGGLLTTTSIVENYPGFPQGVDGTALMVQMMEQAQKFGAEVEFWGGGGSGYFGKREAADLCRKKNY